MGRRLLRLLDLRKQLRFSLATLILLVLTLTAILGVWAHRHPWRKVRSIRVPQGSLEMTVRSLPGGGDILISNRGWDADPPELWIWHWETDDLSAVPFPRQAENVVAVGYDALRFITQDQQGTLRVRHLTTGAQIAELTGFAKMPSELQSVCLSRDGTKVAGAGADLELQLHRIDDSKRLTLHKLASDTKWVRLEFSDDGKWLTAYEEKRIEVPSPGGGRDEKDVCTGWHLFDCASGDRVHPPEQFQEMVRASESFICVSFNHTDDILFCRDKYWRIGTDQIQAAPGSFQPNFFGPRTQFLTFSLTGLELEVWDKDLSSCRAALNLAHAPTGAHVPAHGIMTVSPDGTHLLYTGLCGCWANENVLIWDLESAEFAGGLPTYMAVGEVTGNGRILGATLDGEVQVWQRVRRHSSWGLLGQPEVWLAMVFLIATLVSIRRDRQMAKRATEQSRAPGNPSEK